MSDHKPAAECTIETPLESVPDDLDDDTHKALDQEVLDEAFDEPLTVNDAVVLLGGIVYFSWGRLNPNYENTLQAKALLQECPELVDKLRVAWTSRSFKEIRNLSTYNSATGSFGCH